MLVGDALFEWPFLNALEENHGSANDIVMWNVISKLQGGGKRRRWDVGGRLESLSASRFGQQTLQNFLVYTYTHVTFQQKSSQRTLAHKVICNEVWQWSLFALPTDRTTNYICKITCTCKENSKEMQAKC